VTMGCSASFESASVPQRTGGLGGVPATAGGTSVPAWSVTASDSRSSCSRGGSPSQAASRAKARLVRGSVVRTVCPSSDLVAEVSKRRRTQRSHQGASRVGDGGLAPQRATALERNGVERTRFTRLRATDPWRVTCWRKALWAAEAATLHEGGGGGGLGLAGRAVFASGSGEVTRASERGVASTQGW